jgi:hypothetical protein
MYFAPITYYVPQAGFLAAQSLLEARSVKPSFIPRVGQNLFLYTPYVTV